MTAAEAGAATAPWTTLPPGAGGYGAGIVGDAIVLGETLGTPLLGGTNDGTFGVSLIGLEARFRGFAASREDRHQNLGAGRRDHRRHPLDDRSGHAVRLAGGHLATSSGRPTFGIVALTKTGAGALDPTIDSGTGTIALACTISGQSAMEKAGLGTLILMAADTLTGNSSVRAGILRGEGSIAPSPPPPSVPAPG